MTDFKKTIAAAKAKVADAETRAFMARQEAILEGATPHDVQALGQCVAVRQEEQDAAEASEGADVPQRVH